MVPVQVKGVKGHHISPQRTLMYEWEACYSKILGVTQSSEMSRLDFFLISNDSQFGVDSCENLCPLSSDHSPVKLKLRTDLADDRGRGY